MAIKSTRYLLDLPAIESLSDFAIALNLSDYTLYHLSNHSDFFYKEVKKPKKSGKVRILACPSRQMKAIQGWILINILEKLSINDTATAFRKGKNILNNVENHNNNRFCICMDMENFFGTIPANWVYSIFHALGYNKHISCIFTSLCTYRGFLPQGGVTSPILSNLVCSRLDRRIIGYTGARNISYSRYADDITLSSNNPDRLFKALPFIRYIIKNEGFKLNEQKFKVLRPGNRREITGLVISDFNEIGIGSRKKRELRAKIHRLEKHPLTDEERIQLSYHLAGWMSYLKSVDKKRYEYLKCYWNNLKQIVTSDAAASIDI